MADIYVANAPFTTVIDGVHYNVVAGATVREGHPLLEGRDELFNPFKVDFETDAEAEVGKHAAPDEAPAPAAESEAPKVTLGGD